MNKWYKHPYEGIGRQTEEGPGKDFFITVRTLTGNTYFWHVDNVEKITEEEGLDAYYEYEAKQRRYILGNDSSNRDAEIWDQASEAVMEWAVQNAYSPHEHGYIDPPANPYRKTE